MPVLFNKRRAVQPQGGGGELNQGAPLSRGLRAAFVGGKPVDLTGRNPALLGNFVHVPTPGGLGFGYSSPGSSTVPAYLADSTNLDLPVAHTVFALVYLTTTADQVIVSKGQNGLEFASWALGVGQLDGSGGSTSFVYRVRPSNAAGASGAFDPIVAPTGRVVALAGWHDGTNVRLYREGVRVASGAGSGSAPFNGAARVYIGGDNNAGASGGRWFISGGIPLVLLYDRALTEGEVAALSANPWQVLEPRRIFFPEAVAGGGYSLTLDAGTYSVSGQAATIAVRRKLTAAAGSYSVSGQPATLQFTRQLSAAAGSYTVSGQAAALKVSRVLAFAAGSYALTGSAATLSYTPGGATYTLALDAGSYAVTGGATGFRIGRALMPAVGTYTVFGGVVRYAYSGAVTARVGRRLKLPLHVQFPADKRLMERKLTDLFREYAQAINAVTNTALPTVPDSGTWTKGDVVTNSAPEEAGTSPNKYVVTGWLRVTDGSANVLNTDWLEMRTPTGN